MMLKSTWHYYITMTNTAAISTGFERINSKMILKFIKYMLHMHTTTISQQTKVQQKKYKVTNKRTLKSNNNNDDNRFTLTLLLAGTRLKSEGFCRSKVLLLAYP